MEDLKIKITFKNNLILKAIEEKFGKVNQAEASRLMGIHPQTLSRLLTFKTNPTTKISRSGSIEVEENLYWKRSVTNLAEELECSPWDIFPEHFWSERRSQYEIEVESGTLISLGQVELIDWNDPEKEMMKRELDKMFKAAFLLLNSSQKSVLSLRADGETLQEIGDKMGVSKGRTQQIEAEAKRLIRMYITKSGGEIK